MDGMRFFDVDRYLQMGLWPQGGAPIEPKTEYADESKVEMAREVEVFDPHVMPQDFRVFAEHDLVHALGIPLYSSNINDKKRMAVVLKQMLFNDIYQFGIRQILSTYQEPEIKSLFDVFSKTNDFFLLLFFTFRSQRSMEFDADASLLDNQQQEAKSIANRVENHFSSFYKMIIQPEHRVYAAKVGHLALSDPIEHRGPRMREGYVLQDKVFLFLRDAATITHSAWEKTFLAEDPPILQGVPEPTKANLIARLHKEKIRVEKICDESETTLLSEDTVMDMIHYAARVGDLETVCCIL